MVFQIQKLYGMISKRDKKIFAVTFVAVFLTHAYRLLTYIPNHDSFFSFYDKQDVILLGRWSLTYAAGISSYFDTQWLCGLLSLIYISITAVIVIHMLDIRNSFLCYVAGIIIGVYPSVVCTFTYMYTADAYMLAMLTAAFAAWAMVSDNWKKRLGGSVLLGVGMGIYQAYLSFTMLLLLIWLIKRVLIEKECKIGRYVFNMTYSGLLGGVFMALVC
ncbi:MAG: glucosyltransferase domain-containing protein [Lachnoclostridium sp.]|nr:glucosyltransferase domain-containing protein [Lachnospira sp.]MCM1246993.1 glucosyltransferase domain-containing protein [Lachnoclostridium sp.]MCM1535046.1 glucosyltransferase domain-containing protein [Clostridium sp.]